MDRSDIGAAARAGGIVFVGKLFTWGMRLVLAVLLARLLGASDYGLYTIALSVVAVASALSVFGLDAAMIRFVAIAVARGDEARARGTAQV
ncbi:MAG: oligosaccharide flippase family protein, partial [Chloroflexota bacterium]|nr:oligosaccharide flippase family protein [Chloroflexota bacterium]